MLQAISKFVTGSDTAAAQRDNVGGRYDQQGFDVLPVSTAPHGKIAPPPAYAPQQQHYNDCDPVGPPAPASGGAGSAYYIQQQQYVVPQRAGGGGQYQQPAVWGASNQASTGPGGRSNQDLYVAH